MLRCITVAAVACALAAVAASPALADSMVFIKAGNVWIANPDGSGQYQVTLDGTAGAPYETPSEADDGTVVAIRQAPGQRRQIYRMTQSGGLLNPPINTPAPGTGAIDAKVSPDGKLVAYWFVTTVNDPLCPFCVNAANQVLLSHADRFTGATEVGTPNTGGWPSWIDNDTITLGSGSATQWYYSLGMNEAAEWFTDSDLTGQILTLLDAEVAPTGDRIAVVHGDNQEEIVLAKLTGPPPTLPASAVCALQGPSGKFVDPTWQSDGRLLAWQEDDGVWTMAVPSDVDNCAAYGDSQLRVPGGRNPDLSPAAVNPGPRPGCGNPGNPSACPGPPGPGPVPCTSCTGPGPSPTPVSDAAVRSSLTAVGKTAARALKRLRIGGLLHKRRFVITYTALEGGTLTAKLASHGAVLATGRHAFAAAGTGKLVAKLTAKGRKRLRGAGKLPATLSLSFTPPGAAAIRSTIPVRLRR